MTKSIGADICEKKEKQRRCCDHLRQRLRRMDGWMIWLMMDGWMDGLWSPPAWIKRMYVVLCPAPPNGCRATQHAEPYNPPGEQKRKNFSVGDQVVGRQRPAKSGVLIKYFGGLWSISRLICMIFVANLTAYRLKILMSAVACNQ